MSLFKKKNKSPLFFEEDPAEERFDAMMDLVKDLSRKDYNRLKDAMDLGYNAYQKVKNIDSDDGLSVAGPELMLHEKEGEEWQARKLVAVKPPQQIWPNMAAVSIGELAVRGGKTDIQVVLHRIQSQPEQLAPKVAESQSVMDQVEKKKNMFGGLAMSSFRDRFGQLTVEQARELNEAARWYCGHEVTSEVQDGSEA